MNATYDRETDILLIRLSDERPDYAEQADAIITHYSKEGKAVEFEILDASKNVSHLMAVVKGEGEATA